MLIKYIIIFPWFVINNRILIFFSFLINPLHFTLEDKHYYTLEIVVIEKLEWSITVATYNLFGAHKQNKK